MLFNLLVYVSCYYGLVNFFEVLINGLLLVDGKFMFFLFFCLVERVGLIVKENCVLLD